MTGIILPVTILGACIGSFLNVVIYRLPKRQSFIFDRSHCTSCNTNLKVFDLFPVISWIFLKGRCRYCSNFISKRYLFVELCTSFLFLICLKSKGFPDDVLPEFYIAISGWLLVSYLIVLFMIDIDEMILPNSLTYSGAGVGLALIFFQCFFFYDSSYQLLLEHFLAYLIAIFGITLISFIVKLIIKKPALGAGDAKLFAMTGAWLGLEGLEVTITLSFLLSSLIVISGLILRLIKRGEYIPFGPYICVSIFLVWFYGPQFWFDSLGDIFWWKYL